MSKLICEICPNHCQLDDQQTGFCHARSNIDGKITSSNYGLITSMALDPIEKKPLYNFCPGSMILSVGSYGCNFRCSFCQNYQISMADSKQAQTNYITPYRLVKLAVSLKSQGNIGIAYTYNEPLIGYEFVMDCAQIAKLNDLKNVLVTNGYICAKPLKKILPYIDALNIDLKAFNEEFYRQINGDLDTVKQTIKLSAQSCHVEITTLIIPGENDSEEEIRELSRWLSSIRPDIPLHLTRFFPRYQMTDRNPTDINKINALADVAREYLDHVYIGNC